MAGLPRQPITETMLYHFVQYLFTGRNFYSNLDEQYIFAYLTNFNAPTVREPRYSNIGYGILGDVLQRRTGKAVDDLLTEYIARPLKLSRTGYTPEDLPGWDDRAYGHAGDQPKFVRRGVLVPDWRFTKILRGSAALYSTAHDLLAFAAAHLRDDDSIQTRALKDTLRIRYSRPREAAAVAWIADDVAGLRITYQVGMVAGYSSYLGIDVANRTAVVVLQNAFNWDITLGHKLLLLLADTGSHREKSQSAFRQF
jgi:CubicO group peptidase (beta-lactamase class C family)